MAKKKQHNFLWDLSKIWIPEELSEEVSVSPELEIRVSCKPQRMIVISRKNYLKNGISWDDKFEAKNMMRLY